MRTREDIKRVKVELPIAHPFQAEFIDYVIDCLRLRNGGRGIVRAGRRGGKTVGAAEVGVEAFIAGYRVLYTAPTAEQVGAFWFEVTGALAPLVSIGYLKKNESENFLEVPGTERRIKAKTAWNADTMRGDWADLLIMDEFQLTNEDAWDVVAQPMLLDRNGVALFIYTPPSLRSVGISKAIDPRHAAKMFKMASEDISGHWRAFHFTSYDNPHISRDALGIISQDMSRQAYRQEILAEDDELQLHWLVYRAFNESCKRPREHLDISWPVHVGHDFGPANPAALFVAQDPGTGNFYEFAEYTPGTKAPEEQVEDWKAITEGMNVQYRYGGAPNEEEIRHLYTVLGWPILKPKHKEVNYQLERVIGMMEQNKINIFSDMYRRLEEINNCLWTPDNEGRPTNKIKDEAKYHLSACARYLYSNFQPETVFMGKQSVPVSNMMPTMAVRNM